MPLILDSHLKKEEGKFFIAVGESHVVGDHGIAALLAQRHWQLKKIDGSTDLTELEEKQKTEEPAKKDEGLTTSLRKLGVEDLTSLENSALRLMLNCASAMMQLKMITSQARGSH